jgi:hypothetical protein
MKTGEQEQERTNQLRCNAGTRPLLSGKLNSGEENERETRNREMTRAEINLKN